MMSMGTSLKRVTFDTSSNCYMDYNILESKDKHQFPSHVNQSKRGQ